MGNDFWRRADWGIPVLVAIGACVDSSAKPFAHLIACTAFLMAGLWLQYIIFRWSRRVNDWRPCVFGVVVLVGTAALLYVSWPAAAQLPLPQSPSSNAQSGGCLSTNSGTMNNDCNETIISPPREPNDLYQDGQKVGEVTSLKPVSSQQVLIMNPHLTGWDSSLPLVIQNKQIVCPTIQGDYPGPNHNMSYLGPVTCTIIGVASP